VVERRVGSAAAAATTTTATASDFSGAIVVGVIATA
jgi:hypothetical protein